MSIKVLQLHKRDSYELKFIQDKVSYDVSQRRFALADGTTQSFRSEVWAEMVTNAFVKDPVLTPEALIGLFTESADAFKSIDFKLSGNPAMASLERTKLAKGATATFIGAKVNEANQLSIVSLGDSNVFVLRSKEVISFPFKSVDELDKNNHFLNTEKLIANEVEPEFFQRTTVQLAEGDLVILATDALSRLLLKDKGALEKFLIIKSFDEFHNFCVQNWNKRQLEEDDITALIFCNDTSDKILSIMPPQGFSFPRKEEKEFSPSFGASRNSQPNQVEMQQYADEINRLTTELGRVRKKAKLQSIVLFLILGLLSLNILSKLIPESFKVQANSVKEKLYQIKAKPNGDSIKDKEQAALPLLQGNKLSDPDDRKGSDKSKDSSGVTSSGNTAEDKPKSSIIKNKQDQPTTKDNK